MKLIACIILMLIGGYMYAKGHESIQKDAIKKTLDEHEKEKTKSRE